MEEYKENQAEAKEAEMTAEERKAKAEELRVKMKQRMDEMKKKSKEANEALSQGKGRLHLETPIMAGEEEVTELPYDFTTLTGMEYADAMDFDMNAQQIYRITSRQALALFAKAAAKQVDGLDMKDIIERIGGTDALEGVQLATLFFSASTRAGRLRISKM